MKTVLSHQIYEEEGELLPDGNYTGYIGAIQREVRSIYNINYLRISLYGLINLPYEFCHLIHLLF